MIKSLFKQTIFNNNNKMKKIKAINLINNINNFLINNHNKKKEKIIYKIYNN